MKQIGIIGAGAAGLCALRHTLATPGINPVIWEHSTSVGGTWVYSSKTETDQYHFPIHSSMYESLRTNLPKEIMGFPDFPFRGENESFVHHTEVFNYLNEYSNHFNLMRRIKFEHHVHSVERIEEENGNTLWEVEVENLRDKTFETFICGGILICNGHYSVPRIPKIKDIETFPGTKIHSHEYRHPDPYKLHNVVVLGASSSGVDISLELSTVANQVYLSHNFPILLPSKFPKNVIQVKGVMKATSHGFVLVDGTQIKVDDILFCTGYEYQFPFLRPSCEVEVVDNCVKPLYKHIIHTSYPSMGFIGLVLQVLPFPLFEMQICFFLAIFIGKYILPSKAAMDADALSECKDKLTHGNSLHHFHKLGDLQWSYNNQLAKMAGVEPLPKVIEKIYIDAAYRRQASLTTYKETKYDIIDSNNFQSFDSLK